MADVDTDADYTPDTEAICDGYFHESEYRSAPYFDLRIDGITLLDEPVLICQTALANWRAGIPYPALQAAQGPFDRYLGVQGQPSENHCAAL